MVDPFHEPVAVSAVTPSHNKQNRRQNKTERERFRVLQMYEGHPRKWGGVKTYNMLVLENSVDVSPTLGIIIKA